MNPSFLSLENKIQRRHYDRLAFVYVRQSTIQQIEKHSESTKLQYALVDRAVQLGWPAQRVVVIDDDLRISGSTAEGRPGFQKLVAEVGVDHVGIILGTGIQEKHQSIAYEFLAITPTSWGAIQEPVIYPRAYQRKYG